MSSVMAMRLAGLLHLPLSVCMHTACSEELNRQTQYLLPMHATGTFAPQKYGIFQTGAIIYPSRLLLSSAYGLGLRLLQSRV